MILRTFTISDWLAISSAFASIPMAYLAFTLEGRADTVDTILQGGMQVAGTALFVVITLLLKRFLIRVFGFHDTDKSIDLMVMANIVAGMFLLGGLYFPEIRETAGQAALVIMVFQGLVQIRFGYQLLKVQNNLGGLLKPFCYLNMATGVCVASLVLILVGVVLSAISDLMLATIFFNIYQRAERSRTRPVRNEVTFSRKKAPHEAARVPHLDNGPRIMMNSERTATFFGVIVAGASLLDWYLFDTLRNPRYTDQERFLYENFLDRPARVMSFPEMSIVGVTFLLAYCLVIVWSSNLAWQTVEQLWRTVRELTANKSWCRVILPISLLSLLAAVPAGYVAILFHNGAYLYPKVMGSYFAMLCGLYVYVFIFTLMLLATGRRDYGRVATDHR